MLPILVPEAGLAELYRTFLRELVERGFEGDVSTDYAQRLITATDNSVYQIVPQAVVHPKNRDDVTRVLAMVGEERFRSITLSPRGGGTGTNGQSLTDGIVVDLSRYMTEILELDLAAGYVRVQPGVVLDQLNAYLKPHGVFFAPNLSPSSRATIGGMINTDACGKGSRIYGKTSQHVLELEVVVLGGTTFVARELSLDELHEAREQPGPVGAIYRSIDEIVTTKRETIERDLPKLKRFLTGYDLAHVYSEGRERFSLTAILAGSEGTLGFITEAKLRLTPLPKTKKLFAIRYAAFDDALRAANVLVQSNPGAIETVDDTIVGLAQGDPIWLEISHLVTGDREPPTKAINLVEFESDDPAVVDEKVQALARALEARRGQPGAATGYTIATQPADIAALWNLRKKGVGLLGNAKGERRPVPFVEDTAVPPERLADYIRDFRAILDRHGLRYGMFGHVDVGCLHVRPALNLRDPEDERLMRKISDEVAALVRSYGGVLWGEHGKGYRSEYSPTFFGPELYEELRKVKATFDPHNQLNPGKLATPAGRNDKLVSVDAMKRGEYDRQIGPGALVRYETAVQCNGNGACFDWDPDHIMCPSAKVTRDRIHSPKGRAGMMREWLRLTQKAGFDASRPASASPGGALVALLRPRGKGDDFSHEVYDAMNGCLACKACATQCPIKVDVPSFRSEFLAHYHTRYRRPLRDYFFALFEKSIAAMALAPSLANRVLGSRWVRESLRRIVGIVDTPLLHPFRVSAGLELRGAPKFSLRALQGLSPEERTRHVVLVQDAFTSFFDGQVLLATYDLLTELGYHVHVAPFRENGKGLHIKGFMRAFARVATRQHRFLEQVAATGVSLVGLDPAVTLTYRDEYPHSLGLEKPPYRVHMLSEWLCEQPFVRAAATRAPGPHYQLLGHCTERALAPKSMAQWRQVFAALGGTLETPDVGCCGMCGVYGHEAIHAHESRGIFEMSWGARVPSGPGRDTTHVLTTGYSCRSQVKRFRDVVLGHPVEALLDLARKRRADAPARLPAAVPARGDETPRVAHG